MERTVGTTPCPILHGKAATSVYCIYREFTRKGALGHMSSRNRVAPTSPRIGSTTASGEWGGLSAISEDESPGSSKRPSSPPLRPQSQVINSRMRGTSSLTSADIFSAARELNALHTSSVQSSKGEPNNHGAAERAMIHSENILCVSSCTALCLCAFRAACSDVL